MGLVVACQCCPYEPFSNLVSDKMSVIALFFFLNTNLWYVKSVPKKVVMLKIWSCFIKTTFVVYTMLNSPVSSVELGVLNSMSLSVIIWFHALFFWSAMLNKSPRVCLIYLHSSYFSLVLLLLSGSFPYGIIAKWKKQKTKAANWKMKAKEANKQTNKNPWKLKNECILVLPVCFKF